MTTLDHPPPAADLVTRTLSGDRQAFTVIVQENQSLICSLAYAATGSIPHSEDISQEVFYTAWRNLGQLREPAKLRSWLCGIARNLIQNARRRAPREQTTAELPPTADPAPSPPAQAITNEEQSLLWRSLGNIPESYRDPLILFYRQEHSIAQIADALDLSEEAVRQRLSRGRKLLQGELESFVERALQRSAPGSAFTASVIAALPAASTHTAAAALSATTSTKAALWLKIAALVASPLLIVTGYWAGYRMSVEGAPTDAERACIRALYARIVALAFVFVILFVPLAIFGRTLLASHPTLFTAAVLGIFAIYSLNTLAIALWWMRQRRRLRAHLAGVHYAPPKPSHEYRGPFNLLGLPLVHIRCNASVVLGPTVGWIAIGDDARGLLFAFGGRAVGLVAVGGTAIGGIAFGGLAIGALSLGGFSVGLFAVGGLVLGYDAFGGCAAALHNGIGSIVLAHHAAVGALAQAPDANNLAAETTIRSSFIYRLGSILDAYAVVLNLLWVIPLMLFWGGSRRHRASLSK